MISASKLTQPLQAEKGSSLGGADPTAATKNNNNNNNNNNRLEDTVKAIDALHAKDPKTEIVNINNGQQEEKPAELLYAQRMSEWLHKLCSDPSEELQIAVRSQHLCRWEIARKEYPMNKAGYFRWRTDLKERHAAKAAECMEHNGYDREAIQKTMQIIEKQNLKQDHDSQTMEDCACLVFIENGFLDFAAKHPEEKVIDIVQKTWKKMSEQAHDVALKLDLPEDALDIINKALS
jgi:hypothetical protein